jgi:hypothetical protein
MSAPITNQYYYTCFLLKRLTKSKKIDEDLISVTELLGLDVKQEQHFWDGLTKKYEPTVSRFFGDKAIVRLHGKSWFIIFKTKEIWDSSLEGIQKERMAKTAIKTLFQFNLSAIWRTPTPLGVQHSTNVEPSMEFATSKGRALNFGSDAPTGAAKKMKLDSEAYLEKYYRILNIPESDGDPAVIVRDGVIYVSSMWSAELVSRSMEAKNNTARKILHCLDTLLNRPQSKTTSTVQDIIAAFASVNPQISPQKIEMILSIGGFSFMRELEEMVKSVTTNDESANPRNLEKMSPGTTHRWSNQNNQNITLKRVCDGSFSTRSIYNWVERLAIDQAVNVAFALEGKPVFYQEDGGHDGQDIKFVTYWDEEKEEVSMTMIDADTAPKTSLGVAKAAQHSLRKVEATETEICKLATHFVVQKPGLVFDMGY